MRLSDLKWEVIKDKERVSSKYIEEEQHWGLMQDQTKRETFERGFEMGVLFIIERIEKEKSVWKLK
jgi:hypothetical protein